MGNVGDGKDRIAEVDLKVIKKVNEPVKKTGRAAEVVAVVVVVAVVAVVAVVVVVVVAAAVVAVVVAVVVVVVDAVVAAVVFAVDGVKLVGLTSNADSVKTKNSFHSPYLCKKQLQQISTNF